MPTDQLRRPSPGKLPDGAAFTLSPVFVLSRTFAARPSSLPEANAFVRSALSVGEPGSAPAGAVTEAIKSVLLASAGAPNGSFDVVVRIFPDDAEIEVLSGAGVVAAPVGMPPALAGSFARWLADSLRKQGLSHEAAARQLGVSVRTVGRWVRGQTEPRLRDIRKISDRFGPVPRR